MNRRESELIRLAESIVRMTSDIALATAGTPDAAYARQDAKFNQGTITIIVTRNPEIAALIDGKTCPRHGDVSEAQEKYIRTGKLTDDPRTGVKRGE